MKILFALLLVPATAIARDHSVQASLGMVTLLAIGAVVWGAGAAIFKWVFGKKPSEGGDDVKPEGK
ncbi:hypothetical protein [Methylobacter svalbardensis]|uniref:hypothetical protein n=1 Tax=Methylobacter svalbardensis TaxID=3080016 RepID=UPI0030EBCD3A